MIILNKECYINAESIAHMQLKNRIATVHLSAELMWCWVATYYVSVNQDSYFSTIRNNVSNYI